MTSRPPPLVPPEIDLRDYPEFPLEYRRVFKSGTYTNWDDRQRVVGLRLWAESWGQEPCGSMPDNDRELAELAGYGNSPEGVKAWKKIRPKVFDEAGWVICSDGRWYHPVVAEKAIDKWRTKRRKETENAADRQRKQLKRAKVSVARSTGKPSSEQPDSGVMSGPMSGGRDTGQTGVVHPENRAVEEEEKEKKTTPLPPPAGKATFGPTPEARAVVDFYLQRRFGHWPTDIRMTPTMTLTTQAQQYLDAGASVALAKEVIEIAMAEKLRRGEGAPANLRFCCRSMETATGNQRRAEQRSAAKQPATAASRVPRPDASQHRAELTMQFEQRFSTTPPDQTREAPLGDSLDGMAKLRSGGTQR